MTNKDLIYEKLNQLVKMRPSLTMDQVGNSLLMMNFIATGAITLANLFNGKAKAKDEQEKSKLELPPPPATEVPRPPPPITVVTNHPHQVVLPATPITVSELSNNHNQSTELINSLRELIEANQSKPKRKRGSTAYSLDSDEEEDSDSDDESIGSEDAQLDERRERKMTKFWKSNPLELKTFTGETQDWAAWKLDAKIVLNGMGFTKVMASRSYSKKNQVQNRFLFTLLYQALRDGSAAHHCTANTDQDGYKLWRALRKDYEGDPTIVAGAAEKLADKLRNCVLVSGVSASSYISKFSTLVQQIQVHEGYALHPNTVKTRFINNIIDPAYQAFADHARTTVRSRSFRELTEDLRIYDDKLQDSATVKRATRPRRLDYSYERPTKVRRIQQDDATDTGHLPSVVHPNLLGIIKITPHEAWKTLDPVHRSFVQRYNAAVRHKDPTPHPPAGVTVGDPVDDGAANSDIKFNRRRPRRATTAINSTTPSPSLPGQPTNTGASAPDDESITSLQDVDLPLLPANRRVTFHVGNPRKPQQEPSVDPQHPQTPHYDGPAKYTRSHSTVRQN